MLIHWMVNHLMISKFYNTINVMIISHEELRSIVEARHSAPHDRLGMHYVTKRGDMHTIVVRAYLQDAESCWVVDIAHKKKYLMEKLHNSGFFEKTFEKCDLFRYKFLKKTFDGRLLEVVDPYSFLPTISQFDCYLFGQGKHRRIYEKLGAQVCTIDGVTGVAFAVWAPNARRVSVVGDFNKWDGRYHPMRMLGVSGIWELFIPGMTDLEKYKFEIIGANGNLFLKSDPYGSYFEGPPNNAAVVFDHSKYSWKDERWIDRRKTTNWRHAPISIYEVHFGSWRRIVEDGNRPLRYQEMGKLLAEYVKKMGFTHVEFMPLTEYPFAASWGYQVTGFYAMTHRYGTPDDFREMVDILHADGIGVIMDWVPAHFPKDAFALARFDGTCLYEHEDRRRGEHGEWGTLIFNYGRHEVRNFLIGSVLNLVDRYHVDGVRVDAVASMLYLDYGKESGDWLPNQYGGKENIDAIEFFRELNDVVHEEFPGVLTIAEESTSFSGVTRATKYYGLGFDFKWNMGWMHDTLAYFGKDPIYRKYCHNQLTFAMLYQYSENFISAISHDEVVYGKRSMLYKMPGATISEKARHLMALYSYMWLWPSKKSLFMGCEFGQSNEWQYDKSLDWHLLQYCDHQFVQKIISDLNRLYKKYDFLYKYDVDGAGFEWISCDDCDNSVISFLRKGCSGQQMLVVCNFTPVERVDYRVGVPQNCFWREIFNSDSEVYGGLNRGNFGGKNARRESYHYRQYSLDLYLPPLSVLCFIPEEAKIC